MPPATPRRAPAAPAAPPARRVTLVVALVVLAALVVLVLAVEATVTKVRGPRPMTPYVAPQYWLSYEQGFVRRALPGEVLRLLGGARPPTLAAATTLGVGLSLAAALAVGLLALLLARRVPARWAALAVAAVVAVSPLGISLYTRDLGRSDAAGVVVLVALAALPWRRLPAPLVVVGVAALTAAAVAAGEFLVVVVVPVGVVAVWLALDGGSRRRRTVAAAVCALPPAAVAVASAVVPVPLSLLTRAVATARAAGVPPPVPIVPGHGDHDAVSRLKYGFVENMRTYYALFTPAGVVATTLVWGTVFAVLLAVVWHLLGRRVRGRGFALLAAGPVLAALALSVAGIDYRRWWSLALVTALCLVLQVTAGSRRPPGAPRTPLIVGLLVLALAGVLLGGVSPYWDVTRP